MPSMQQALSGSPAPQTLGLGEYICHLSTREVEAREAESSRSVLGVELVEDLPSIHRLDPEQVRNWAR